MGQGMYIFCEQDSIAKENSAFKASLASLEQEMILKCNADWAPKTFNPDQPTGGNDYWGRTTILPALFRGTFLGGVVGTILTGTWRQRFNTVGHQLLLSGRNAGYTIPEDFKIAWAGLAFPNKNQHITEIRFQIGDRKYGRIDLEEMLVYNKPALVFTEGFTIEEEQSFDLYGFFEGPIPTDVSGYASINQYVIPLGFAAYKFIDKTLGDTGAAIT